MSADQAQPVGKMTQLRAEGAVAPSFRAKAWERIGVILYNSLVTHVPSHVLRLGILRVFGARIGRKSAVFRGTTVLGIRSLVIGDEVGIGFRCMLDARGGLTIGSQCVIASDVHFITGAHLPHSDTFDFELLPIVIGDHAWIASRATILPNVTIGRGAVVGAVSLVRKDVADFEMVAGVPAEHRGVRESTLDYSPAYRPPFF